MNWQIRSVCRDRRSRNTRQGNHCRILRSAKARKIFDIKPGDNLIVLGDEGQGIALIKEKGLLDLLKAAREEH